jgi:hypothetical protein
MRHRLLALALLGAPVVASAHHGQDFLLIEGPAVPHPGNAYLIADATFALDGDSEERASFAPALLFGASPRVAFELHTHFDDVDGEGWHYEAVAPAVHVLLTDPHKHEGLKVGLSAEYEFGHGEGADTIEARLSAENTHGRLLWAGNLIAEKESHDSTRFAFAMGVRGHVSTQTALGLEAQHDVDGRAGELLAAAYLGDETGFTLKFGIGASRDEDGDTGAIAHVGMVLKLR